jgi:hypothetical protein
MRSSVVQTVCPRMKRLFSTVLDPTKHPVPVWHNNCKN